MWFLWPKKTTVRIVSSDIFAGDAIGNFNFQIAEFLTSRNVPCQLYASNYAKQADSKVRDLREFFKDYTESDVLFCNYSIFEENNPKLASINIPKVVYYHGITPPEYFDDYDALTAKNCLKGINQYVCFTEFDHFSANSKYMLSQLLASLSEGNPEMIRQMEAKSTVFPPFVGALSSQWAGVSSSEIWQPEGEFSILYVGRLAPHKCIHELFYLLESLVKIDVNASLRIIGACAAEQYCDMLRDLLNGRFSVLSNRVAIYGAVSQSELKYMYENSDVFVTMSEHEGYCVPLVEAMSFGLPVFAKARGAVPEVLARSGVLFYDDDMEHLAHSIAETRRPEIKKAILEKQQVVFDNAVRASDGEALLSVLEKLLQKHKISYSDHG